MQFRPFFVEEPFGPEDLANHRRLAEALPLAIATGEIVAGRWAHRELIERAGISVLQADAAVCGGITEWRRIAAMEAGAGVSVAPHSFHDLHRSGERRVGKECVSPGRSRWLPMN